MAANDDAPHKPVRFRFEFDDFRRFPRMSGCHIDSESQTDINGNEWYVMLFPVGRHGDLEGWDDDTADSNDIAEDLGDGSVGEHAIAEDFDRGTENDGNDDAGDNVEGGDRVFRIPVTILVTTISRVQNPYRVEVRVLDKNDCVACEEFFQYRMLPEGDYEPMASTGNLNFLTWPDIEEKNILKDGALCIDVTVQMKDTRQQLFPVQNRLSSKMLKLLKSGEKSDASFIVGDETFNVHSQVLFANAPILYDFLDQQRNSSVVIRDIRAEVFHDVLHHVYTGYFPEVVVDVDSVNVSMDSKIVKYGKELISAANRFELIDMKVAVENVLVAERILNRKNVSDFILFADAQSCPLLKEYATSYFLLHAKEILQSQHSKRLRESAELLSEIIILQNTTPDEDLMSVTELRKELSTHELDIDGSKEMLIERLANANKEYE